MNLSPQEIRRAFEVGQFIPYFQPLVCLRTSGMVGFEVLARWKHPELGMISPETFIPLAEQDGWIGELTHAILRQAFSAASGLSHRFTLSLNISPLQLRDLSLPEQIHCIAEQTGFSLERVKIEITETALAHNLDKARTIAEGLKAMGCRIGLDDFGTGYSSLLHLQSLPFDELKVDRSFVMSMAQRRESRKIVAAVIGLGQSLGLTTVAEGVETREQADMLLWLGCDLGQGWLYGRPEPEEEIPRMINVRREVPVSGARWTNLSAGNLEGLPGPRLAQLQAVYDGAPVGLGFLDRDLKCVNINRRLADMHGASIEEHLGRKIAEVIPKLYPQIEPHLRRALQGEGVADLEVSELNHDTGVGKTFLASYQPARDEAGEVVGVSCAIVDFTARKAAEEKLRQFERVLEGLEEIVVVVDRQYRCVLANRAFHEYVGSSADQHVALSVPELIDNDVFDRIVKQKLVECFQGASVHYEMKYTFPRLGERDLILSYSPIWVSGAVHAAACVVRDVTEVKRMERLNMTMQKRLELAERAGLPIVINHLKVF